MDKTPIPLIKIEPSPARHESDLMDSLRPGSSCPSCKKGRLDYNGLLELECDQCGTVFGSSPGCT